MLPRQSGEVLCFRPTEIPGKEGVKAVRCRESYSKAYPCQESELDCGVVPLQIRSVGCIHRRWSRVTDKMRWDEYGTQRRFHCGLRPLRNTKTVGSQPSPLGREGLPRSGTGEACTRYFPNTPIFPNTEGRGYPVPPGHARFFDLRVHIT